jgi:hypothetical protein
MWNSVLMDGVKWSFDRSSPPLTDGGGGSHPDFGLEESQFRSWNFESHQQTNYADWTNRLQPGEEGEDAEDLFVHHDPVDGRGSRRNYPSAAELFRNFVGKLECTTSTSRYFLSDKPRCFVLLVFLGNSADVAGAAAIDILTV